MTRIWLAVALLAWGCRSDPPEPAPAPASAAPVSHSPRPAPHQALIATNSQAPLPDWAAWDAVDDQCADCHPDVVDAWRASPMGRSLAAAPFAAPSGLPHSQRHPQSGVEYTAQARPGSLTVTGRAGEATGTRAATHVMGSGMHTQSFLWRDAAGAHRVLPLTWYSQAKRWDLTPGYAVAGYPGFERPVKAECLSCHGAVSAIAGEDDGRYAQPLRPIGCSRCHGDPRAHVKGRLAGEATPLLVPTRLPPEREAAICETCHLQGAVRIPRPGKTWAHAAPGQAPGEAIATFVRQAPGSATIASHGERLRRSACKPAEGPLLCTTCHAPHAKAPRDRAAACRDCHAKGKACTGPVAPDCVRCHMARVGTADIPHVSITDHFIRVRPEAPAAGSASGPLVRVSPAQLDPAEAKGLLARAYVEALRVSGHPADRARAEAAFRDLPLDSADLRFDRGSLALLSGDLATARTHLEAAWTQAKTERNAMALADLRLRTGDAKGAQALLKTVPAHRAKALRIAIDAALGDPGAVERARGWAKTAPLDPAAHGSLGVALQAQRDLAGAHAAFTRATTVRPDQPLYWLNRARVALMRGDHADALQATAGRAGAEALRARALAAAGQQAAAAALIATLPPTPDRDIALLRLALARGDLQTAGARLDAVARGLPTDPQTWHLAARLLDAQGDAGNAARARAQAARLVTPRQADPPTP